MDLEDAFKLDILSYDQVKELFLDFYNPKTEEKSLARIESTLLKVTDKNEQISYHACRSNRAVNLCMYRYF